MPAFFVVGHTQGGRPEDIFLDDLAGASGRWDVLTRCVASSLLVSHGVRADTEIALWLARAKRYVRVSGRDVRSLNPDERSTAALLAKALNAEPVGAHEEEALPGVSIGQGDLADVLTRFVGSRPLVLLEEGADVPDVAWPRDAVYVLSDHRDLEPSETAVIRRQATHTFSLGPDVLQADQAIVLVHDRLRSRG